MAEDQDFIRHLIREAVRRNLEAEITDALGSEPEERREGRVIKTAWQGW